MYYKSINRLGKGSYGIVYKVEDLFDRNKIYALKKIKIDNNCRYSKYKESLLNEIRILKHNYCPYLLKLNHVFIERNFYVCLLTPFIKYGDLQNIISNQTKHFEENLVWCYFIQICIGIKYLHDHNIIHRDIKPANIYLDDNNKIVIGDFGISKILYVNNLSHTNIGTPCYMSPELIYNKKYDTRVDIWALGCVLYELLTFQMPFNASNIRNLRNSVTSLKFSTDISKLNYSKKLIGLVKKILILDYTKRPTIDDILNYEEVKMKMYLLPLVERSERIYDFDKNFKKINNISIYNIASYI